MGINQKFLDLYGQDLNFFQLACVFSVPIGLPAVFIGEMLSVKLGAGIAIGSILTGNLILWLTGMGIISMAYQDRINAIENAEKYISKYGSFVFAFILVVVFLNWFVLIIEYSMKILRGLVHEKWGEFAFIRLGAGLGMLTALFSIWGIRLIKFFSTWGLLFVGLYHIYGAFFVEKQSAPLGPIGMSSVGVITAVLTLFPGIINLPTVYRHSRSRFDSYLSLSLIFLFITFFEVSFIWMPFSLDLNFQYISGTFAVLTSIYVVFKLLTTNLLNIYFASACWELFFPKFEGAKGYAIIGMLGTMAYTFLQITRPVLFIRNLTNCYLISLGVVLLIAFLIEILVKHRPRMLEKSINVASWLAGCMASTITLYLKPSTGVDACWVGIIVSVLFFLIVMYLEETFWAIKTLLNEEKK